MQSNTLTKILLYMAVMIYTVANSGCNPNKQSNTETGTYIPSLREVDSVQKANIVGMRIYNEDSLWKIMGTNKILGFGHYHDKVNNYAAFQNLLPKLRETGFLLLALEIPSSLQPLLDSIMSESTPQSETTSLLHRLNKNLKDGDMNLTIGSSPEIKHPLFNIILTWLNLGGVIAAIDAPFIFDEKLNRNIYYSNLMLKSIKEQSNNLYEKIKDVDINRLDASNDLIQTSAIRSAYMAAMLNYYCSKNTKVVAYLGVKHLLLADGDNSGLGVSVVPKLSKYFDLRIFSSYPYFTKQGGGFYHGHQWIGDVAYSAKVD